MNVRKRSSALAGRRAEFLYTGPRGGHDPARMLCLYSNVMIPKKG